MLFRSDGSCASRLDRIFVSKDLAVLKQDCIFFPYSDHKVLCADIDIDVSGIHCKSTMKWKLNTSVLGEKGYQEKIQRLIQDSSTLIEAFDSPLIWWDDFKQRVKAVSIAYCTRRKRNKGQEIECLKYQLEFADSGHEVAELKDRLSKLQDEKLGEWQLELGVQKICKMKSALLTFLIGLDNGGIKITYLVLEIVRGS